MIFVPVTSKILKIFKKYLKLSADLPYNIKGSGCLPVGEGFRQETLRFFMGRLLSPSLYIYLYYYGKSFAL